MAVPRTRSPLRKWVLLENTIRAGEVVKREVYFALEASGFEVCVIGNKLKGHSYIPYRPNESGILDIAADRTWIDVEYDGINLWEVCRGSVGYEWPGFSFEGASDESLDFIRKIYRRAVNFIDFYHSIMRNNRPSAAVVWGGMFLEPRIISLLSRRYDIPVFAIEFSFDPLRFHFDASGRIGNDFSFNDQWRRVADQPLDERENAAITDWISNNYRGKSRTQPDGDLSEKIGSFIASHKIRPLLLLGQCFIDTVLTYDNLHFRDAEDAYFEIIETCVSKGIPLIVKSHPGDREEYQLRLAEKCASYPGVCFVGLEQDENVYRLMDACSAGVTINSQSGLEMIAKGKPVLNVGRSFYGDAGMSMVLGSRSELDRCLGSLMDLGSRGLTVNSLSKAYLHRLLFHQLVDTSLSVGETCAQIRNKISAVAPDLFPEKDVLSPDPFSLPLKVVIIHASPSWAGSGFYLQDLAMELQALGHEVMVLSEGSCAPYDRGIRWRTLEFDGSLLDKSLKQEVREFNPNVVFEAGVRSKPMRAALEIKVMCESILIVQGEDDEFAPFEQHYPGGNMEILDILDKEVITSADLPNFLAAVDLSHSAAVIADPQFDRWVEPLLRSIIYHKADRFTAIWNPMLERLEERFGTTGDLLPPIIRFEDFDLTPLSVESRAHMLTQLQLGDDCLIYFINGTIYQYSDEIKIFIDALDALQKTTDRKIALLTLNELVMENEPAFQLRSLGRLCNDQYLDHIKLADVICVPGVPDTFNRYRLASRLAKGMMIGKPIFTFKTGFAESLKDSEDGFFTHTASAEEWCEVLKGTLSEETRRLVGERGRVLAKTFFDASVVASRLSKSWQTLLAPKKSGKAIVGGLVSKSKIQRGFQEIFETRIPYSIRSKHGGKLKSNGFTQYRLNQWTILAYGFAKMPDDASRPKDEYYGNRIFSCIAVTPHRRSNLIKITIKLGKHELDLKNEISIWSSSGMIASRTYEDHERIVFEFESEDSEFIIYKANWYLGAKERKIFFEIEDVELDARSAFDPAFSAATESRKQRPQELQKQQIEKIVADFESGNFADAEQMLARIIKKHPDHVPYLRAMAEIYWKIGKRARAKRTLAAVKETGNPEISRRLSEMSRNKLLRSILNEIPYNVASIVDSSPLQKTV